jgi:hypothetical protein
MVRIQADLRLPTSSTCQHAWYTRVMGSSYGYLAKILPSVLKRLSAAVVAEHASWEASSTPERITA